MNFKNLFPLLIIALLFNCSSSSSDDAVNQPDPDPVADLITYNGSIKSIIDGTCLECHGSPTTQGAPTSYVTYNQVRSSINNIISRTTSTSNPMPAAPRSPLSQANLDLIQKWQDDGLLEN